MQHQARPLLFLALCLLSLAWASPAKAGLSSLSIFPARQELVVTPGENQAFSVTVANSGKDALRVRAYYSDWGLHPSGEMLFLLPGKSAYSAQRFVTFSPAQFVLLPNQQQAVRVNVAVPAGVEPGEYQGMLFFETTPPQVPTKKGRSMILFSQRLGDTLYVAVPPFERQATIGGVAYLPPKGKAPARVGLVLENPGKVHVRCSGVVKLSRPDGTTVAELKIEDVALIRESKRLLQLPLEKDLAPGRYQAQVSLDYGGEEALEAETFLER
ncbi:hypothetical protein J7643_09225 [bacterium]|nr:hypothetical protein [bacterium]